MTELEAFALLGLEPDASADECRRAYRRLALLHHPDRHPEDTTKSAEFAQIGSAWHVVQAALIRRGAVTAAPVELDFADFFRGMASVVRRTVFVPRGNDLVVEVTLPFLDAISGTERIIELPRRSPAGPVRREYAFPIPAGVDDGQLLRWRDEGAPSAESGKCGDLYLHVHVQPHAVFSRDQLDIRCDLPLSFRELAFGTRLVVPTVRGVATLEVPARVAPGAVLRLAGAGVRCGSGQGDAIFVARLDYPDSLDLRAADSLDQWHAAASSRRARLDAALLEAKARGTR
jgi:molecular chaperone DnaJ